MRGRKATPFALKVLRGNPGKQRAWPEARPEVLDRLPPPAFLQEGPATEAWRRIGVELIKAGVLTRLDVGVLGAYANAYGRSATTSAALHGLAVDDKRWAPLVRALRDAERDMVHYAEQLGLTPAARSRVPVAAPHKAGKFAGLIKGDPA